jgi:hypothetical protein
MIIKYTLLFMLLIVIVVIAYQPYLFPKITENFDDAMEVAEAASKFNMQKNRTNSSTKTNPLISRPPPPLKVTPKKTSFTPRNTSSSNQGYNIRPSESINADDNDEIAFSQIAQQPAPLDPCACNCEDLQRQIQDGCADVVAQLDQCNLRLAEQNMSCASEKGQIEMAAAQNQVNNDAEIAQKTKEAVDAQAKLQACNENNKRLMDQNSKLLEETAKLRGELLSLQDKVLAANRDTQNCQSNYQEFEDKFGKMTTKFTDATQKYKGVADKFYDIADDYMGFVENIDKCAKFSYRYDENAKTRAGERKKQAALEKVGDTNYGEYTMPESKQTQSSGSGSGGGGASGGGSGGGSSAPVAAAQAAPPPPADPYANIPPGGVMYTSKIIPMLKVTKGMPEGMKVAFRIQANIIPDPADKAAFLAALEKA